MKLVLDDRTFYHFYDVKASDLNDRKASCISLIQRALRSFNCESFHVGRKGKKFDRRVLGLVLAYLITVSLPIYGHEDALNEEIMEIESPIDQSILSEMTTLDLVHAGDSVLRHTARELSIDEILSPEIQKLIEMMKTTMRTADGVGLAAPQIGKPIQLIVIEDVDLSYLNPEQLAERNRYPVPFHVIINPHLYIEESSDHVEFFEGCLSVPGFVGLVPRAKSVRVECLNERAEPMVIHAKGWYARILQHEIDHLNGTLYIDRALLTTLMTEENYVKLWKGKGVKEIQASLMVNPPASQIVP